MCAIPYDVDFRDFPFEGAEQFLVRLEGEGGDDAVRPSLPASPAPADQDQVALVALHRELIALRRARPWLTTADLEVTELAGWQPIAVRDGWSVSERA